MLHPSNMKKNIKLSLATLLTTLFLMGTAGVNNAQAEVLFGAMKMKVVCDIGGGVGVKSKLVAVTIATIDISAFPVITANIQAADITVGGTYLEEFDLTGKAYALSATKGTFQMFGVDTDADVEISIGGKYKVNDVGTLLFTGGLMQAQDTTSNCNYFGKIKQKNFTP